MSCDCQPEGLRMCRSFSRAVAAIILARTETVLVYLVADRPVVITSALND